MDERPGHAMGKLGGVSVYGRHEQGAERKWRVDGLAMWALPPTPFFFILSLPSPFFVVFIAHPLPRCVLLYGHRHCCCFLLCFLCYSSLPVAPPTRRLLT